MAKRSGMRGAYRWLSPAEKKAILARCREGAAAKEVVAEFGCSLTHAYELQREAVMSGRRVAHSPHRLSFEERERILIGIWRGESNAEIARAIGRHRSTVGREISKCGRRHHYRALSAERKAQKRARRPKLTKLARNGRLLAEVERGLAKRHSPQQISARLKRAFPDDPSMQISHETIYLSLYVQARGELRRELAKCLRSGRTHRKPQGRAERRGKIQGMVMISERPAEIEDRAVPGHWEGDLIMGRACKSQIATLVERSTRFVLLAKVQDRSAENMARVLSERIGTLPAELRRSLTWDQGFEMRHHKTFSVNTGVPVYFCDPHSPWQRGSNENTNGLLRQYFPKGTDLSIHTQDELDRVAAELNGRPRKTLDWFNPAEKLRALLLDDPPEIVRSSRPNVTE